MLDDYYFDWGEEGDYFAICLGYGSLYNHEYEPNAEYGMDFTAQTIDFYAIKDIAPGDERARLEPVGKKEARETDRPLPEPLAVSADAQQRLCETVCGELQVHDVGDGRHAFHPPIPEDT